jgi:hypothetical protein
MLNKKPEGCEWSEMVSGPGVAVPTTAYKCLVIHRKPGSVNDLIKIATETKDTK